MAIAGAAGFATLLGAAGTAAGTAPIDPAPARAPLADGPSVAGAGSATSTTVIAEQDGIFTTRQVLMVTPATIDPGADAELIIDQQLVGPYYEASGRSADGRLTGFQRLTSGCPPNPNVSFDAAPSARLVIAAARSSTTSDLLGASLEERMAAASAGDATVLVLDQMPLVTNEPITVTLDAAWSIRRAGISATPVASG